ncbi:MAG TPA: ribosome-associated translation inhibitor RaiA [Candidatus Eisenbacteria bacterium]|jgi:putative sigma-54 modulation protein
MIINTTARHCELDNEVRAFAQQRLEKLSRYARDIMEARLIVTAEKYRHTAEITLRLKGHEFVSREQADQPRTAIDLAADRLEHQVRRLKEKRMEHKKGNRTRTADGTSPPEETRGDEAGDEPGDGPSDLPLED